MRGQEADSMSFAHSFESRAVCLNVNRSRYLFMCVYFTHTCVSFYMLILFIYKQPTTYELYVCTSQSRLHFIQTHAIGKRRLTHKKCANGKALLSFARMRTVNFCKSPRSVEIKQPSRNAAVDTTR